ncbi:anthranilate/aminodeoxychorismate synthase component II [Candidatus Marinamargulisbacteria bacterium SCGC AAA071-K20]|nr:anthranilate/aminodeoxychorismate synthase component II [Candidatus Marinamargulisbacteria bacterium SCGC AAA071-K20]
MILIIDNYDSFTYNLVDYFGRISDQDIEVYRNDKVTLEALNKLPIKYIVISPGPKTPKEAGISKDLIKAYEGKVPILGVCLGHQCIGEIYGGDIVQAKRLMHGKTSEVSHKNVPLFSFIPNPFTATRYHSLVIDKQAFPSDLEVLATSDDDDEIMAIKHKKYEIYGVQFHPESICTPDGITLLKNFLNCSY